MSDYSHILEPGGTEVQTQAGGARAYRKPLCDFRWRDLRCLFEEAFDQWSKHNAPRLGAALSFYTLLSLAPLLLFLVAIFTLAVGPSAAAKGVIAQIHYLGGSQAALAAQALLLQPPSATHGVLATIFSLVTLLFGASGVLVELRDALNTIWDVPLPQYSGFKRITAFVKERLFSFALVLAVGFLLVVSLAVSAWIAALGSYSATVLPAHEVILNVVNFLLSFLIVALLFSAIYKFLPYTKIDWYEVVLGGSVTSILFTLGKFVLGFYLGRASFASAYGAAASIVALIAWVYYSAQIFFLGAEFTKVFANHYGPPQHRRDLEIVTSQNCDRPAVLPKLTI